jgi:hypothetical protein
MHSTNFKRSFELNKLPLVTTWQREKLFSFPHFMSAVSEHVIAYFGTQHFKCVSGHKLPLIAHLNV